MFFFLLLNIYFPSFDKEMFTKKKKLLAAWHCVLIVVLLDSPIFDFVLSLNYSLAEASDSSRPALRTARLQANQTRIQSTTSSPWTSSSSLTTSSSVSKPAASATAANSKTSKTTADCQCRPEEFTCSSGANNSRRKGQLSFTVKVFSVTPSFRWPSLPN